MKIYIVKANDGSMCEKAITAADKMDLIYILYEKDNSMIPIELVELIGNSKAKIKYLPYINSKEELFVACLCGVLSEKYKNSKIVCHSNNLTDAVAEIQKFLNKEESSVKKSRVKNNEKAPKKTIESVSEREDTKENISIQKKSVQKNNNISDENLLFEQQYAKLQDIFTKIKTKDFSPVMYTDTFIKAIKQSITDNVPLDECLDLYCSKGIAIKAKKAFAGVEEELKDIVANLHDEII